jgi:hypothetical protein
MSSHRMSIGYHYACILAPTVERVEDQVGLETEMFRVWPWCIRCPIYRN